MNIIFKIFTLSLIFVAQGMITLCSIEKLLIMMTFVWLKGEYTVMPSRRLLACEEDLNVEIIEYSNK